MFKKKALYSKKILSCILSMSIFFSGSVSVFASEESFNSKEGKWAGDSLMKSEHLDRGLVATITYTTSSKGVFLSWRLTADEVKGHSDTGLTGANFNVYRDGKKIATVEESTNYQDKDGDSSSKYYVRAVVKGKEVDKSQVVTPWKNQYYDLPLQKPADGVTPKGVLYPNGEAYTYNANDMSVGDVDGDGKYEYFVKWDPSNSKDVSQRGYTGKTYIDCYKFDGTLLYRIDLGVNIRAGAHYTQFMVYDFDRDGKAEIMLKTAPGTKITRYDKKGNISSEKYITMPKEDIEAGYSNKDDYRLSAQGYYDHVVNMFMNWDKHPEVVNGNWPKTLEECFGIEKQYNYPLSKEDAMKLTDYFMDVYAPSRSEKNKLREYEGFIVDGPEYLSVFNGATGKEMDTVKYTPGREDDGLRWGDYSWTRIEPANRVDRFLAGVAYLDGKKPYAVFARGYYTRSTIATYTWNGNKIKQNWFVDSGWTRMTNPFNDSGANWKDELNPEYATLAGQGAHTLTTADVDNDGKDEIVYGSATIDHNGKLLYSSSDILPEGSASPGKEGKLGHGDSIHVADIDPSRKGLEIFMCHEGGTSVPYGSSLRDAKAGKTIFGTYSGKDTGRCMIGDIDPTKPGLELWSNGFWQANGTVMEGTAPGTNANIKWGADMTTQIIDGSQATTPTIQKWDYKDTKKSIPILTADGTYTNNGTKGNPCLVADIFGDWREELLLRKTDNSAIRIYLSTEITNHKLYTLMQDRQYRTDVARQNDGYNQPAYTSFYFGSDIDWSKVPIPRN
ncbi:rhamnogalacturonan lyase [Clostridium sp. SHJSY1]|uniref:rhamnogalacturonan lyase n=1 Tax=Clostridium sp. SHJSY1 TaxID=2942483 RepID=UPI00287BBD32|nr:rhamnogalacturonan lyase [Clostridium sp. SHJSY1]